jgi:putative transposase
MKGFSQIFNLKTYFMDYVELEEGKYYHIYNRGNNRENLFFNKDNYDYFLKKYDKYLSNYLDTYAYCLLPNHFHLLVCVKPYSCFSIKEDFPTLEFAKIESFGKLISERFRRFFMSYAKSIAVQNKRTGSLFQKNFKRREVKDDAYFSQMIYYIHRNPLKHKIFKDFENYPHSSYQTILSDKPSKIKRNEVLDWFGNKEAFIDFHKTDHDLGGIEDLLIED